MSRTYKFQPETSTPIVSMRLFGQQQPVRVWAVFDTGAARTQFHTPVIDRLGYSARDAVKVSTAYGPAGPMQDGYDLRIAKIEVFGKVFEAPLVAAYDFDHLADQGIRGLLGFDIIKQLHLELNGLAGTLSVY